MGIQRILIWICLQLVLQFSFVQQNSKMNIKSD